MAGCVALKPRPVVGANAIRWPGIRICPEMFRFQVLGPPPVSAAGNRRSPKTCDPRGSGVLRSPASSWRPRPRAVGRFFCVRT